MNISIIGTGKIVQEALPVIAATDGIFIRSILARQHSLTRAEAMAETFGIPLICTDYEAVLADDIVEAVYIALINSVHFDFALRALKAGKHVILEKPACLCADEFRVLAEEARAHHLMLCAFDGIISKTVLKRYLLSKNSPVGSGFIPHINIGHGISVYTHKGYFLGMRIQQYEKK